VRKGQPSKGCCNTAHRWQMVPTTAAAATSLKYSSSGYSDSMADTSSAIVGLSLMPTCCKEAFSARECQLLWCSSTQRAGQRPDESISGRHVVRGAPRTPTAAAAAAAERMHTKMNATLCGTPLQLSCILGADPTRVPFSALRKQCRKATCAGYS
jgi:hypothetical protein